jgi:hypothetical protein
MDRLKEALDAARTTFASNHEFEDYVGKYISKKAELELKRHRRVIGG